MKKRTHGLVTLLALGAVVASVAATAGPAIGGPLPSAAFAIGDGNTATGSTVTFWGSQWWKDNSVSAGAAPASFKGYALDVDAAACTFSTRPGNSPPPPSGPLPRVITVLVTSSVTKSGATISGTITGFAQVATNDGYDADPGHAGTGTVLNVSPCGGGGVL